MKAIETVDKGIRFRSRLEARWAVFFDAVGVKYQYEPEGYVLSDGTRYLPDFYLPDIKMWVEVKGVMSNADQRKIDLFREAIFEESKLIVVGDIPPETDDLLNWVYQEYPAWECFSVGFDFPYLPCICPACGRFGWEFEGRGARGCQHDGYDKGYTFDAPIITAAYRKARQARFEHGEVPK